MGNPYIIRLLELQFLKKLEANKVMLILGARRTGKTSFLKNFIKSLKQEPLLMNGEDLNTHRILEERTINNYKKITENYKVVIIDEAQKIPDIGIKLKLMVDEIDGIKIIATGSSTFDLNKSLGEPLTGRKKTFYMYPLAQAE